MSQLAIWNDYMRSYDLLTEIGGYQQSQQDILDRARPAPGVTVLDAGSGTGNLSIAMRKRGANVVSCDFSPAAIAIHRAKDPGAVIHELSLEKALPFDDGAFDRVCCASVLFALSKDGCVNAISEFRRVLRPGGKVVITVPSRNASVRHLISLYLRSCSQRFGFPRGLWRGLRGLPALGKIARCNAKLMRLPDWEGIHFFDANELADFVHRAGFEDIVTERTYGGGFLLCTGVVPFSANRSATP